MSSVQWQNPSGVYTSDMVGSGQSGVCQHCNLPPTPEGHDGCLGTLPEDRVMNACCGHGDDRLAYVQGWDGQVVKGNTARELIDLLTPE